MSIPSCKTWNFYVSHITYVTAYMSTLMWFHIVASPSFIYFNFIDILIKRKNVHIFTWNTECFIRIFLSIWDGRTKKVRKAPGTSIPTPVPVPPTNETKDSDSFVAAPPKRDILEDKLEIDSQVSQVIDSDSPVPTGPAASLDCKFNVGDKIRVS